MHSAGIPLHQALHYLSKAEVEGSALAKVSEQLHNDVVRGKTLSGSMAGDKNLFDKFILIMVKVGETTGRLDVILNALAEHLEWVWQNRQKLKGSLTYPAFSLVFCLAMAIIGPAYILRGQLDMLRNSNIELPLITRALIVFSDLFHSPVFLTSLGLTTIAVVLVLQVLSKQPQMRVRFYQTLMVLPVVSEILRLSALTRFTKSLSLLLKSGVVIVQALPLACSSSGDPKMAREGRSAVSALVDGESLTSALTRLSYADSMLSLSLEAGEQSGKVAESLDWVGRTYAQELENRVERLTALLEPVLMLFTGLCVGLLLVATLLPTVKMLESI